MAGIPAPSQGGPGTSADGTAERCTGRSFAFEWDRSTDAFWGSPAGAGILGLPEQTSELDGEAYLARIHPADRERFARRLRHLSPAAPSYHLFYRVRRPDGATVLLEEQGRGTFDGAGYLLRVTGFAAEAGAALRRHHVQDIGLPTASGLAAHELAGRASVDCEAQLRFALAAAEVGIWSWDLDTGEVAWSPESYALYGRDPAAGPPSPGQWLHCLHRDDREAVNEALWDAVEGRAPELRAEFRIVHPVQGERWLLARGRLERGPDKVVRRLTGIHLDITERKALEAALRRREREFQTLAENAPDIITRFDRDLRHVYVNAAVSRATGRPPEEFLGKTNEELGMPAELCRLWSETFREVLRTARPRSVDFDFPAPGGHRHYSIRAVPEFGPEGVVETVLSIARDETARRRTEQALEQSRARLERVITGSQDGYWEWDFGTGEVWVSARWNQIVGRLAAEGPVPVEEVERLVHPDDLPRLLAAAAPILEGRDGSDHYELEYRFRCPDGAEVWVHSRARVTERDAQGTAVMISGLITDITLRKRMEEALREADRRKNEFLAMLGHELRNPLAPIRNAAEVMRLLDPEEPRLRWAQEVIERQVKHLTRLVDDLLDLSRIVRGKIVLEPEPLLLVRLVDQAVAEVRDIIDRHGHRLTVTLPREPLWLHADPVRLGQVLVNLLHNAAKYTPDGGEIHLLAEAADAELVIRVRDTGSGIAPTLLPHVFELFAQGEQPLDRRQGGLGIGLTVVQQLVALHGGRVNVASAGPDRGAEFSVWLPRHPPPEPGMAGLVPMPTTKSQRVLVVDDDDAVADTTVMWLQLRGYEVEVARDGQAALEVAPRFQPDVVLLDIGLPDVDGYQVARRLRVSPAGKTLLLVAVTGYGHQEAVEASRAAGFDHHLVKPVDPQALIALLG